MDGTLDMARPRQSAGRASRPTHAEPVYLPVDPEVLEPGDGFDFDLFAHRAGSSHVPFRARHSPFTREDRDRLTLNGVPHLYVDQSQEAAFRVYFRDLLDRLAAYNRGSLRDRCRLTMACGLQVAQDLLATPEAPTLYRQANKVADAVAALATQEAAAPLFLLGILRHDAAVATHLFNVAAMSVALAVRMDITEPSRLQRIAFGGLLHDIGKSQVPGTILDSTVPLSEEQMIELRDHPDHGLRLTHRVAEMTPEAARMIHQHHERLDGTGYPIGLSDAYLPTATRICAVVDVYDAMTCPRPHRTAFPPTFVVEYLLAQAATRLDRRAVAGWVEIVRRLWAGGAYFTALATESAPGGGGE